MCKSLTASLIAVGAISLPLPGSGIRAAAASPRTTPPIGTQLAELKGSDTVAGDFFGRSVAISGTTAVVSAPFHGNSAGEAFVFTKTATGWKQLAELKGSDTIAGDEFGYSVAISGNTAVVGALGHGKNAGRAYVFTETATGWKQLAELKGSDTIAGDEFGYSVAISGNTAVVGALGHGKDAGRAYVFTETATGWKQPAELKGSDTIAGDFFGSSVAISANTAVVGASGHGNSAGRAYVFIITATGCKQAADLKGSDTIGGDKFGSSVAISGTTAVVSASNPASAFRRAFVFTEAATGWKQAAELKGSDTVARDFFGTSVAISGTTAIVSAPFHGTYAGAAYLFEA
jgi:hypothetical protein